MQVDFYQLGKTPLEHVLPRIAERVLEAGGRLLIVAENAPFLAQLDRQLWRYTPASFLPHALAGTGDEADQPVLLSTAVEPLNNARNLALADGLWRDEALAFDRAFLFFDAETLAAARAAWKALAAQPNLTRNFWQQVPDKGWQKIA